MEMNMDKVTQEQWDAALEIVKVPKDIKGKVNCMNYALGYLDGKGLKMISVDRVCGNKLYFSVSSN